MNPQEGKGRLFGGLFEFQFSEERSRQLELHLQDSFSPDVLRELGILEKRNRQIQKVALILRDMEALESLVPSPRKILSLSSEEVFSLLGEAESLFTSLATEIQSPVKEETSPVFVEIKSGQGGMESCSWVSILANMYKGFGVRKNAPFRVLETDETCGGFRRILLVTEGISLPCLAVEAGSHRLSRFSPFGKGNRRQTSFASVSVWEKGPDVPEPVLRKEDMEVSTCRASGPGGQNVNKVETAVRIVHRPSGLVAFCREERTQERNRVLAEKRLREKLLERMRDEQNRMLKEKTLDGGHASFGHRIRSYILAPNPLVKDHRTGLETNRVDEVLSGNLELVSPCPV